MLCILKYFLINESTHLDQSYVNLVLWRILLQIIFWHELINHYVYVTLGWILNWSKIVFSLTVWFSKYILHISRLKVETQTKEWRRLIVTTHRLAAIFLLVESKHMCCGLHFYLSASWKNSTINNSCSIFFPFSTASLEAFNSWKNNNNSKSSL